ncbi:hypothetical protein [Paenibacillus sp. AGC30]
MAARSAAEDEDERRREIVKSASQIFSMALNQLEQSIRDNAPSATIEQIGNKRSVVSVRGRVLRNFDGDDHGLSAKLGSTTLTIQPIEESVNTNWGYYKPAFQVLAYTSIEVQIPPNSYGYEGREHSLWFCDAEEEGVFHWYETAYMYTSTDIKRGRSRNPFSLSPGEESGKALSRVFAEYQVAWPFLKIQIGNEHEFFDRWMNWFAQGAMNQLSQPSTMPERNPYGTWRQ